MRLDLHYFTAYLLLGTDLFTKHSPSYAKGDTSWGTTFALPSAFFSTNPLPVAAAQESRVPLYPSHTAVQLQDGVYCFYLGSLVSIQPLVPYYNN